TGQGPVVPLDHAGERVVAPGADLPAQRGELLRLRAAAVHPATQTVGEEAAALTDGADREQPDGALPEQVGVAVHEPDGPGQPGAVLDGAVLHARFVRVQGDDLVYRASRGPASVVDETAGVPLRHAPGRAVGARVVDEDVHRRSSAVLLR